MVPASATGSSTFLLHCKAGSSLVPSQITSLRIVFRHASSCISHFHHIDFNQLHFVLEASKHCNSTALTLLWLIQRPPALLINQNAFLPHLCSLLPGSTCLSCTSSRHPSQHCSSSTSLQAQDSSRPWPQRLWYQQEQPVALQLPHRSRPR